MEKKTKLTITLALAVLVITLSLGAAISIAPNESGAQTAAPIQPEIELQIQPEIAAPIQPEIELQIQPEIAVRISPETEQLILTAQFGSCSAPTTCGVFHVTAPPHEAQTIYTASPLADRMLFTHAVKLVLRTHR